MSRSTGQKNEKRFGKKEHVLGLAMRVIFKISSTRRLPKRCDGETAGLPEKRGKWKQERSPKLRRRNIGGRLHSTAEVVYKKPNLMKYVRVVRSSDITQPLSRSFKVGSWQLAAMSDKPFFSVLYLGVVKSPQRSKNKNKKSCKIKFMFIFYGFKMYSEILDTQLPRAIDELK